ncbi:hypothetical protein CIG75_09015 [Tumebacillus algifaecis]|uniref:Uncharacterized protein n=1 Tax=Tumebacillus algifaecis TaxID=1214604 RepID=A0A223D101_9BACL|nr:hypothetical protein [Tumebacillus algifaecis]ASS75103.1 hypothetical protein CIG75_09015 [Tumebacillus algifaecis]
MEAMETFECPSCGHVVKPDALVGEKGHQEATCMSCAAKYARTFARYEDEWVFGLWRSKETGRVACSYYKTAFGTDAFDCD